MFINPRQVKMVNWTISCFYVIFITVLICSLISVLSTAEPAFEASLLKKFGSIALFTHTFVYLW